MAFVHQRPPSSRPGLDDKAQWSPDGSRIGFATTSVQCCDVEGFDIDIISADRGASEERPRWSPDGAQLAYYPDVGGSWDVYAVLLATGATRSLTDSPGFDGQPTTTR
jgi:Tol biopolymer transport system component